MPTSGKISVCKGVEPIRNTYGGSDAVNGQVWPPATGYTYYVTQTHVNIWPSSEKSNFRAYALLARTLREECVQRVPRVVEDKDEYVHEDGEDVHEDSEDVQQVVAEENVHAELDVVALAFALVLALSFLSARAFCLISSRRGSSRRE